MPEPTAAEVRAFTLDYIDDNLMGLEFRIDQLRFMVKHGSQFMRVRLESELMKLRHKAEELELYVRQHADKLEEK